MTIAPIHYNSSVILFTILLLTLFTQCKGPNNQPSVDKTISLPEDEELIRMDISPYSKIAEFFQSGICEAEPEETSFYNCMQSYYCNIETKTEKEVLNAALKEQDFMFSKMNYDALQMIWISPKNKNKLHINIKNEYMFLLTEVSRDIPTIKYYKTALGRRGQIPRDFTKVFKTLKKEAYDDERVQLILAVHYFTLNKLL